MLRIEVIFGAGGRTCEFNDGRAFQGGVSQPIQFNCMEWSRLISRKVYGGSVRASDILPARKGGFGRTKQIGATTARVRCLKSFNLFTLQSVAMMSMCFDNRFMLCLQWLFNYVVRRVFLGVFLGYICTYSEFRLDKQTFSTRVK